LPGGPSPHSVDVGKGTRTVRKLVSVIAGLAGAVQAAAPAPPYTIARMGSAIDAAEIVGTRRAGTLCLPDGSLRWSDVADAGTMDQRELAEDAFEDAGVPVTPLGTGPERATRLRGTVRAAHFSMCARRWLGGGSKALSGDATLTVEWRAETMDGAPPASHVSTVSRRIDAQHAAPAGAIYRLLLGDAARDAAGWLKGN
jgi:hypothetical protein